MKRVGKNSIPVRSTEARDRLLAKAFLGRPTDFYWYRLPGLSQDLFLEATNGANNIIEGRVIARTEKPIAEVDRFFVGEAFRGKGLGERLLKDFVIAVKDQGAEELWSESVSPPALGLRLKVFGEACLNFYEEEREEVGFLPITVEQAMASNARRDLNYARQLNAEETVGHVGIHVDLTRIDTSSWSQPVLSHRVTDEAPDKYEILTMADI